MTTWRDRFDAEFVTEHGYITDIVRNTGEDLKAEDIKSFIQQLLAKEREAAYESVIAEAKDLKALRDLITFCEGKLKENTNYF